MDGREKVVPLPGKMRLGIVAVDQSSLDDSHLTISFHNLQYASVPQRHAGRGGSCSGGIRFWVSLYDGG